MAPWGIALLLTVCPALVAGAPECQASGGGCADASSLLQTPLASGKATLAAAEARSRAIRSGDAVLFRVARTGRRLTALRNGIVHARWNEAGQRQRFIIEKEAGGGDIRSGDAVFLTAEWTGMVVAVGDFDESGELDSTAVHAKWDNKETWERLKIERGGGAGPISAGDEVFLQAWTGARVDADAPDDRGVVQARFDDQGEWQKLIIEATTTAPATTAAPASAEVVSGRAWENFQLLNRLRARGFTCPRGAVFGPNRVALKFDCRLWRASQLHSEDMAAQNYFGHDSLDGRTPWQRAAEQGTRANAENIAAGSSTAAGTLEQWKNSDGHCKHMMNEDFKVAAVGYGAGGRYGHYWTQMFSLSDSGLDTSCYPRFGGGSMPGGGAVPHEEGNATEIYEEILAEPVSRLPT